MPRAEKLCQNVGWEGTPRRGGGRTFGRWGGSEIFYGRHSGGNGRRPARPLCCDGCKACPPRPCLHRLLAQRPGLYGCCGILAPVIAGGIGLDTSGVGRTFGGLALGPLPDPPLAAPACIS